MLENVQTQDYRSSQKEKSRELLMKGTLSMVGRSRAEAQFPPEASKERRRYPNSIGESQHPAWREQIKTGTVRQQGVDAESKHHNGRVRYGHKQSLRVPVLQQPARVGIFKMQVNQKGRHQAQPY